MLNSLDNVRQCLSTEEVSNSSLDTGPVNAAQTASRAENMALSHPVVLVSLGWKKEGAKFLKEHFPAVDWTVLWHRIDLVFDAQEHLDWYGTDSRAQEQFKQIYPNYEDHLRFMAEQCLEGSRREDLAHFLICKSGHHRSVCFVELLRKLLNTIAPELRVVVWHLDHTQREGARVNLRALQKLTEDDYEDWFEEPLVTSWRPTGARFELLHRRAY